MGSSKTPSLTNKQFAQIAKALAEPRRYAMLEEIGKSENQLACSQLRENKCVSSATISHHVKELEAAGLITTVKDGKFIRLKIERETLKAYITRLAAL